MFERGKKPGKDMGGLRSLKATEFSSEELAHKKRTDKQRKCDALPADARQ